jgi:hypothetical protein
MPRPSIYSLKIYFISGTLGIEDTKLTRLSPCPQGACNVKETERGSHRMAILMAPTEPHQLEGG